MKKDTQNPDFATDFATQARRTAAAAEALDAAFGSTRKCLSKHAASALPEKADVAAPISAQPNTRSDRQHRAHHDLEVELERPIDVVQNVRRKGTAAHLDRIFGRLFLTARQVSSLDSRFGLRGPFLNRSFLPRAPPR
jgi:hypothetical protein